MSPDQTQSILALLPGSRLSEVRLLARPFIATAIEVCRRRPGLQLIAPMANTVVREQFMRVLRATPGGEELPLQVLDGQARAVLTAADAALVASGTATLEALLCRCPMIVAYRFGTFTVMLLRLLRLVRVKYMSLPNLLADEAVAPEFLQEAVTADNLSSAVEAALQDRSRHAYLEERFLQVHNSLRAGGAGRAADVIIELFGERKRARAS
jgi:lipid-A-disaccharide synthase